MARNRSSGPVKKARKRSSVKDLPPKDARKVKGGDTASLSLLSSIQKTSTDTKTTIIKNI